ncbi:hypothetical protein D3C87_2127300 [compost metagenome]
MDGLFRDEGDEFIDGSDCPWCLHGDRDLMQGGLRIDDGNVVGEARVGVDGAR